MREPGGASAGGVLAGFGLIAAVCAALAAAEMVLMAPARDLASPRVWWTVLLMHAVVALGLGCGTVVATGLAAFVGRYGASRLARVSASDWGLVLLAVVLGFTHGWPVGRQLLEGFLPRSLALAVFAAAIALGYVLMRRFSRLLPNQLFAPVVAILVAPLAYYLLRSQPLGLPATSGLASGAMITSFALLVLAAMALLRRARAAAVAALVVLLVLAVRATAPDPHGLIQPSEQRPATRFEHQEDRSQRRPNLASEASTRRPVFLIVADTLRADALDLEGGAKGRTPELDRLAVNGDVFTRAIANASWTLPGHASLFTGLRASRHRLDLTSSPGYGAKLDDSLPTLHQHFAQRGYATSCISANGIVGPASDLIRVALGTAIPDERGCCRRPLSASGMPCRRARDRRSRSS